MAVRQLVGPHQTTGIKEINWFGVCEEMFETLAPGCLSSHVAVADALFAQDDKRE